MQTKDLQLNGVLCNILIVLLLSVVGMTKLQAQNITFADANVKAICVTNWDTDGDGELSQAEAAAVTSLDGVFMFDDDITTFDELSFFTGLTAVGEDEFNSCTSLTAISIPNAVTSIGNYAFSDCLSLTTFTSYACTPPTLGSNVFDNVPSAIVINVPCHTSAIYQATNGWSDFSNYEEFEYGLCPIPFIDANVKAICVAHWDTNSDGELSYAEAAAVTNLGTHFKSTSITSFDELEHFTGLTSIPNTAFYGCTSLASITIPSSISALGNGSFYNCTNLATMTVYSETPPTVGTNAFKNVPNDMVIYVSCRLCIAYHNASGWSEFANIQGFGPCIITFADANVKALCVANWDTDDDGELTYAEAAAVTNLGAVFQNKPYITSFDELKYFISLTSIGSYTFVACSGLTSIEIPDSVTTIGQSAFSGCNSLISIEIPNSITSISNYTFYNCSGLTSIVIPNSVTMIGQSAFSGCSSLISIEIPNSVTSIDNHAFNGCSGLTGALTIPNSVISIGYSAFASCSGLTSIEISNSVTSINISTFSGCSGLTSIEIPNSVSSIGERAFWNCSSLTTIKIPNSVSLVGSHAFSNCSSLNSIVSLVEMPPVLSDNSVFYNVLTNIPIYVPCNVVEDYQMATGWNNFTNIMGMCSGEVLVVVNPSEGGTVTGAGYYTGGDTCVLTATPNSGFVFGNWTENGSVVSTDSVYSFYAHPTTLMANFCSNTPIDFADANVKALCVANWDTNGDGELSYIEAAVVTDIGEVFRNNSSITSFNELQYFTSLTQIGNYAFYYCTGLISIVIPNSVTTIGGYAFYYCTSLTTIEIPNSVTSIGGYGSFYWCSSLTSIEIPNSVTSIGSGTFEGCKGLTSLVIPNSVISIGAHPFCSCNGLEQIIVDSGNMFYDSRENCNAIIETSTNELVTGCKNTMIPNSVTSIGFYAFYGHSGLTSIEIPNSVTSIGSCAFYLSGLTSIEIPYSVTSIGYDAFNGCRELEEIIVDPDNSYYDSRENCNAIIETNTNTLITGCTNTVILNIVISIGSYAFYRSGLTSIEIPNSVTSIGTGAFMSCEDLTSIEIPNSVTSIGTAAFNYCSGLTSVILHGETPPLLGNHPYLNKSIPIYVPCGTSEVYQVSDGWSEFTNYIEMCPGTIIVEVLPEEGGTVIGGGTYSYGATCTLTAAANEGYTFMYWTENGNQVSSNACYSFIVIGDRNLVANFALPFTITASANPTEGGIVMGTGSHNYGTTATLTATANSGYVFFNWTENGEEVSSDEEYVFTVMEDRNLMANFIAIPPVPIITEYYPDTNEINSSYVKVHWAAVQSVAQIGEGTSTFGYFPFYTLYNYSIAENLFLASELLEAEVTSSPMTSLSWYATNAPGYTQQGISIWMANVSDTELTTTSHTVNNMTLVYTGAMTPEIGWNEFVFNEGTFSWDGVSNVLIFCQRNNGEWNSTVKWQASNVGFNASSYNYRDSAPYDVNVANTMNNISTTRPNIIMKGSGSMTYNLYRSNCDYTGAQLIAENLSETEYIDATWWQLENDSYKYGVSVADSTNTEIFWSNCIENNYNPTAFHFITTGNWSIPSNWSTCALPGTNDIVFIDAPCQLDQNATVTALTVSDGQSLTLQSYKILTVTGNLTNTVATSLVIEDGAQLIHNVANVQATVKKLITPFNGTSDSWHLIALPFTGSINVASVTNLLESEYDLYGYDESTTYWKNSKTTERGFTELEAAKGYLYANGEEVTLGFSGTLENSSATITVPLSFTDGAHLSGFNLVGNPFPCNAYLNREYYVLTTDGTEINPEPIPATTPIPSCTAVFVKAVAVGETVVFTRVVQ